MDKFETTPPEGAGVMPKNTDVPVPFVIEPPNDSRRDYAQGDSLDFQLVLIGRARRYLPYFIVVFDELGKKGLGSERGHFRLESVHARQPVTGEEKIVYSTDRRVHEADLSLGVNDLEGQELNGAVTLEFLTPTRIKYRDDFVRGALPFEALARALMRRVSALAYFHAGEKWETNFRDATAQAAQVKLVEDRTQWVDWERYSTRQKQKMNLGGLVGRVRYAGEVSAFGSLLRLGELVHVGKACAFGNGKYRVLQESSTKDTKKTLKKEGSRGLC